MSEGTFNRAVGVVARLLRAAVNMAEMAFPPAVRVDVRLGASWIAAGGGDAGRLQEAVAATIANDLVALGIPGDVAVEIRDGTGRDPYEVEVTVNDRRCMHSPDFVERISARHCRCGVGEAAERRDLDITELLATIVCELVRLRPSLMFGPAQRTAWLAANESPDPDSELDPETRVRVAVALLDDRLSIEDVPMTGVISAERRVELRELVTESVIPSRIEIRVNREYLRELTVVAEYTSEAEDRRAFIGVRGALFHDLGASYPDFQLVIDDTLPPQSFAFMLNHLTTSWFAGLAPNERLALHDSGQPLDGRRDLYPTRGGVVTDADADADARSLTPIGYIAACLAREVRLLAPSFVHRGDVERRLQALALLHPTLIAEARTLYSTSAITSGIRALLAEGVSVRPMRRILEWAIEATSVDVEADDVVVAAKRLPIDPRSRSLSNEQRLFSYVRLCTMAAQVRASLGEGVQLSVLALDPRAEAALGDAPNEVPDDWALALAAAIRSADSADALLVSRLGIRAPVRRALDSTFPDLRVYAAQELPIGVGITTRATVTA